MIKSILVTPYLKCVINGYELPVNFSLPPIFPILKPSVCIHTPTSLSHCSLQHNLEYKTLKKLYSTLHIRYYTDNISSRQHLLQQTKRPLTNTYLASFIFLRPPLKPRQLLKPFLCLWSGIAGTKHLVYGNKTSDITKQLQSILFMPLVWCGWDSCTHPPTLEADALPLSYWGSLLLNVLIRFIDGTSKLCS